MKHVFLFALIAIVMTTASCRKIREDNLVKGLWQIQAFKIDTNTINDRTNPTVRAFIDTAYVNGGDFMHSFLGGYTANKAAAYYRIKYERDDITFSYYSIGDSNIYTVLGRWDLPKAEEIYQKADNFIDGFFTIKNKSLNEYEFTSDRNYIRSINDTVSAVIKIKRVK